MVVDKPCGILTTGKGGLDLALRKETGLRSLRVVHRLDRDTSGCLLVALNPATADQLVDLFRRNKVRKIYHAIILGALSQSTMTIRTPVNGQRAVTRVQRLECRSNASLIRVVIETGRTHQIRKHLAGIGHPVAGDRRYGPSQGINRQLESIPRQMLHSRSLAFPSLEPGGDEVVVQSPLPADFLACLKALGMRAR
jgi:RluA family pseudouridine synthase